MEFTENPNYYIQERPYKSKYICCDCRKTFKRKVATDFNGTENEQPATCPDCGRETTWIGPKFRPPKSQNIKTWNSIAVLSRTGLLNFMGFANNQIPIPESTKSLKTLLNTLKENYLSTINRWVTMDYDPNNAEQIRYFNALVNRINLELKKL